MGACFLCPKGRQVPTVWLCKPIYVPITWVTRVHTQLGAVTLSLDYLKPRGGNRIRLNECVLATYADRPTNTNRAGSSPNDQTLTHTRTHKHAQIEAVVIWLCSSCHRRLSLPWFMSHYTHAHMVTFTDTHTGTQALCPNTYCTYTYTFTYTNASPSTLKQVLCISKIKMTLPGLSIINISATTFILNTMHLQEHF